MLRLIVNVCALAVVVFYLIGSAHCDQIIPTIKYAWHHTEGIVTFLTFAGFAMAFLFGPTIGLFMVEAPMWERREKSKVFSGLANLASSMRDSYSDLTIGAIFLSAVTTLTVWGVATVLC